MSQLFIKFIVYHNWNVVIDEYVLPDVCLGLMHFYAVEAFFAYFLTLKHFLEELIFMVERVKNC